MLTITSEGTLFEPGDDLTGIYLYDVLLIRYENGSSCC